MASTNPYGNPFRPSADQVDSQVVIQPGWIFGWTAIFSGPGNHLYLIIHREHWVWRRNKDAAYHAACRKRDKLRDRLEKQGELYDKWQSKQEIRSCK